MIWGKTYAFFITYANKIYIFCLFFFFHEWIYINNLKFSLNFQILSDLAPPTQIIFCPRIQKFYFKYSNERVWWFYSRLSVIYMDFIDFDHQFCVGCNYQPILTTIPQFPTQPNLRPKYLSPRKIFDVSTTSLKWFSANFWYVLT